MNNDNAYWNLHSMTKSLGWLRYWGSACHVPVSSNRSSYCSWFRGLFIRGSTGPVNWLTGLTRLTMALRQDRNKFLIFDVKSPKRWLKHQCTAQRRFSWHISARLAGIAPYMYKYVRLFTCINSRPYWKSAKVANFCRWSFITLKMLKRVLLVAISRRLTKINLFFYSFAAGEICPAIPVVENAQLLFNFLLRRERTTINYRRSASVVNRLKTVKTPLSVRLNLFVSFMQNFFEYVIEKPTLRSRIWTSNKCPTRFKWHKSICHLDTS